MSFKRLSPVVDLIPFIPALSKWMSSNLSSCETLLLTLPRNHFEAETFYRSSNTSSAPPLQGNDSVLELFTVLSEEEVQRKMAKKLKKAKKKAAK